MDELLAFMEGKPPPVGSAARPTFANPWNVHASLKWDDDANTFVFSIAWGDNLGKHHLMSRRIWPACGLDEAVRLMVSSIRKRLPGMSE